MLAWLASLGIGSIAKQLIAAYAQKADAKTEQERIAADERIRTLEARAKAQRPVDALIRVLFALPVALYFGKLFLWDKVLGWGVTDPLSADLRTVAMTIIGFYFVTALVR
jgi:hypothetical protein